MEKIDDEINQFNWDVEKLVKIEYEMVSLEDFDIGDVIVVYLEKRYL